MKLRKVVALDANRSATVHELTVKQVRHLVSQFSTLTAKPLHDLLGDKFAEAGALLNDCIDLPPGESLDDLTGSEIEALSEAFKEVNAAFLRLAGMGHLVPAAIPSEV